MRPSSTRLTADASTVAALRAGDEVDAVFACSRKDRLRRARARPTSRSSCATARGAIQAARSATPTCCAGRFDRGDLVRVRGRVERFRDELQVERARDRARRAADPAAFLPVAYRDLDELDGFLEHLAREVHDPAYARAAASGCSATATLRAEWRRAPCTRGGHHAYLGGLLEHTVAVGTLALGGVHAAPASELRTCCSAPRSCTTSARRASSPTAPRSG